VLVVPVIDLMEGHVVHARRGDRASYRPLQSRLTPSSAPVDVVRALLDLAPFPALYVADIDAIAGRQSHDEVLHAMLREFPQLEIWLDAGFAHPRQLAPWVASQRLVPVIGSESLTTVQDLAPLLAVTDHAVLSLDSRGESPLGPPALFEQPLLWPRRVIVMTLDRVGAQAGPAFDRLRALARIAPDQQLIAAGGVRSAADLETLAEVPVHAVLIATAIHDGTLDAMTLKRYTHAAL
jgi:phosphoribosylformimino-5-aminoimidazole carboxamide ribotide isomerase